VRGVRVAIATCWFAWGCGDGGDAEDDEPRDEHCNAPVELASLRDPALVFTHSSTAIDYFSPRPADLDGDGKLEILASGGNEFLQRGEIVALDGTSGDLLWRTEAEQQLYGSPALIDVTGDGVLDVFAGGRNGAFAAVDGASGEVLWRFAESVPDDPGFGVYNFYTAIPIDDLTNDGVSELLLANGGWDQGMPGEPRPPGHLLVLDAKTGALLAYAPTPDGEETYMSPLIVPDAATSSPSILFGTGGETRSGGLWRTTLDDVLAGDISAAEQLVAVESKGVIAPPAFGDLDGDGRLDIVVATFDGRLTALGGANDEVLWELAVEGTETYSTPTLGFFDADDRPDVFGVFLHGVFPDYASAERVVVNGRDGSVLWRGETVTFTMAGDVAIDLALSRRGARARAHFVGRLLRDPIRFDVRWNALSSAACLQLPTGRFARISAIFGARRASTSAGSASSMIA